ncbi:MAG TPA: hypothetical protein VFI22_01115 [Thermomicrobiales bacterium]|nr:hypothetical protein [Thermomicrobiales bacterium]
MREQMNGRRGRLAAAGGLTAMTLLLAPGLAPPVAAQDATPAAVTSDQGAATETPAPASAVGGATTSVPRAGVGPTAPSDGELASLLGVAAAAAAIAASLLRQRKPTSGR